jgi:hypothetical protein
MLNISFILVNIIIFIFKVDVSGGDSEALIQIRQYVVCER